MENPEANSVPPSRRRWVKLGFGILLSVLFLGLAFQGVDVWESWTLAKNCRGLDLVWAGLIFLAMLGVRALRWQYFLAAQPHVRWRSCMSALCLGFFLNNFLPFRLGDLARVRALRNLEGISAAHLLGTVAVERIFDILTLVFLLGLYLALAAGGQRAELYFAGQLALGGCLFFTLLLIGGYLRRAWVQHMVGVTAGWINRRLGEKVAGLTGRFLQGLQVFVSWRQAAMVVALSLLLWGGTAFSYYFVGQALGLDLGWSAYLVVVFATAFGAIIPAAPGGVGTFHGFARLGLYLVAVNSGEQALAFAAVLHATEWILTNLAGLYFLTRDRLTLFASASGDPHATTSSAAPRPQPAYHAQSA